jgi:hypothetical protein
MEQPMPRNLNPALLGAALCGIVLLLLHLPAIAETPSVEAVLAVLGMDAGQIAELAQGKPVTYSLKEGSADELGVGLAWYLPVPLLKVTGQLRLENPDLLDVDVTAHGMLTEHDGTAALAPIVLSKEEAEDIMEAEAGDEFNLSAQEIDSFKTLKQTLKRTPYRAITDAASQQYREILLKRFEAYRRGGTEAIAAYARQDTLDSKPSLELRQSAQESPLLTRYFPALNKAWLEYPKPLPPGTAESFPWVQKDVEGRSAAILRHRINVDWNGGVLVLTREFYAAHSYNSSQWITGCMSYRDGTVVFQQVRSYTDQVAGVGSEVKHLVGRELLKDKMVKSFERLCGVLGHCR